jgi:alpha-L-rhamnosidase
MPGYKHIKIKPHIGGNLSFANADLQTNYGLVSSHWKVENGQTVFDVEIPANTLATVYIPATSGQTIKENGLALSNSKEIKQKEKEAGYFVVEIGSGKYHFTIQ